MPLQRRSANEQVQPGSSFKVTEYAGLPREYVCSSWDSKSMRLAACLSDGIVQILKVNGGSGIPSSSSSFKLLDGATITAVAWTSPELGSKVACGTAMGDISIWSCGWDAGSKQEVWTQAAKLPGGTPGSSVLALQFGVGSTASQLVSASSDGKVQIYTSLDLLSLATWQLQSEFNALSRGSTRPAVGASSPLLAGACISFNPSPDPQQPPAIALGTRGRQSGHNSVQVWEHNRSLGRWRVIASLVLPNQELPPVNDIAWAPNMGRPHDLIAVAAGRDVAIWQLKYPFLPDGSLPVQRAAHLQDHAGEVRQVGWDMTGSTLASSGTDGKIFLWKAKLTGEWTRQAVIVRES